MPDEPSIFDADGALTRDYLLARGYCCENGCRNCPYGFREREKPQVSRADPAGNGPTRRMPEET